jgi:hypothetical protein
MELDFINIMTSLNERTPDFQCLSQGDEIFLDNIQIKILWPPRIIENKSFTKSVEKAIIKFNGALKKEPKLKKIYENLEHKENIKQYFSETKDESNQKSNITKSDVDASNSEEKPDNNGGIPFEVLEANKSLRKVANRLSLAFQIDNDFLFMGDLESHEINCVIENLEAKGKLKFTMMLSPHHGTRWSKNLIKLKTYYTISSVGSNYFRNIRPNFKEISYMHLLTFLMGDIEIPSKKYLLNHRLFRAYLLEERLKKEIIEKSHDIR